MTLGSPRWGIGRFVTVTATVAATLALSGCGLLLAQRDATVDEALRDLEQDLNEMEQDLEEPASPSATTEEDVFDITVGDCLPAEETGVEGEISTVLTVPCSEPHSGEAYASGNMPDGSYPGDTEVQNFAEDFCSTEFDSFVGIPLEQSTLSYSYYFPTPESWAAGDREILCVVYDPAGDVTGSLQGAAR